VRRGGLATVAGQGGGRAVSCAERVRARGGEVALGDNRERGGSVRRSEGLRK
jgi:hypothetical protein